MTSNFFNLLGAWYCSSVLENSQTLSVQTMFLSPFPLYSISVLLELQSYSVRTLPSLVCLFKSIISNFLFLFFFFLSFGMNILYWAICLIILTLFLPVFNLQLNSSIEFLILIIVFFSFRISALFLFYGFYFSGKVIFSSMFWTYLPVFDNSNTWIIYGSFFLSFRYDFLVYLIIFCWMPDILYEKL